MTPTPRSGGDRSSRTPRLRPGRLAAALFAAAAAAICGPSRAEDWPQVRQNAARTGASVELHVPPLAGDWSAALGSPIVGTPVVAEGRVVGTTLDGRVRALDAATGAVLWAYSTDLGMRSGPAIASGRCFVTATTGHLRILDLGGAGVPALLGSFPSGGTEISSPTVSGGVVYFGSTLPNRKVMAVNATTGLPAWERPTDEFVQSSPAVDGGALFVGTNDGTLYALDASDGSDLWPPFAVGGNCYLSSPAASGGRVFFFPGGQNPNLYARNAATGAAIWSADLGAAVGSPAMLRVSSPCVGGGRVFVAAGGNAALRLSAFDAATGAASWALSLGNMDGNSSFCATPLYLPTAAGGVVVVPTQAGKTLRVFDAATGASLQTLALDASAVSSPVFADGRVYVGTLAGTLYAFRNANGIPAPPAGGFTPSGGFSSTDPQPTLSWNAGFDAEDPVASLRYDLRYGTSSGLDETGTLVNLGADVTTFPLPAPYPQGTQIFWQVRTIDTAGTASPWSAVQDFWVSQPSPGFGPSPGSGTSPQTVVLEVEALGPGREPVRVLWDFDGDGIWDLESGSGGPVRRLYGEIGSTTGRVWALFADGSTSEQTFTVTITAGPNAPAISAFRAIPKDLGVPASIPFQLGGVVNAVAVELDFEGDGVFDEARAAAPTLGTKHLYSAPGTYSPRLRLHGADGQSRIVACDPPSFTLGTDPGKVAPAVDVLTAAAASGAPGRSVRLVAHAAYTGPDPRGRIVTYAWDFEGDGRDDCLQRAPADPAATVAVDHIFATPGAVSASVRATDSDRVSGSAAITVTCSDSDDPAVWIASPLTGARVGGNAVPIEAGIYPADGADEVRFYARPAVAGPPPALDPAAPGAWTVLPDGPAGPLGPLSLWNPAGWAGGEYWIAAAARNGAVWTTNLDAGQEVRVRIGASPDWFGTVSLSGWRVWVSPAPSWPDDVRLRLGNIAAWERTLGTWTGASQRTEITGPVLPGTAPAGLQWIRSVRCGTNSPRSWQRPSRMTLAYLDVNADGVLDGTAQPETAATPRVWDRAAQRWVVPWDIVVQPGRDLADFEFLPDGWAALAAPQ